MYKSIGHSARSMSVTRGLNVFRPAASLLVVALIHSPAVNAAAADGLLGLLEGTFSSAQPAESEGGNNPQLTNRHVRVSAPELGSHVMYLQLNSGPEKAVSRQRILIFSTAGNSDQLRQLTWSLQEPEAFVDAWDRPEIFAELTEDDLVQELPPGCAQLWEERDDSWYGRVDPANCRIWSKRRDTWLGIEAETRVTAAAYMTAERGFNEAGEQVFGTAPDEYYVLNRR